MAEPDALTERFEAHRAQLRAVAYRMLGSLAEAEDAVQEVWLRLARVDAAELHNLGGWLRTVLSRVCLDVLRARTARREVLVDDSAPATTANPASLASPAVPADPADEAVLADSVGRALLVVLNTLGPDERVAFVLHDLFAVPFDEIAPIVGRTPATAKKLASRARQRLRGAPTLGPADLARHRRVIDAFLAASRSGNLDAILALLSPDVLRTADAAALPEGRALEVRGARPVAEEITVFGRNAQFADLALVDGRPGLLVAPEGRLRLAITFTIADDRIAGYHLIADPTNLATLPMAILEP